jgi:hypothetical protein
VIVDLRDVPVVDLRVGDHVTGYVAGYVNDPRSPPVYQPYDWKIRHQAEIDSLRGTDYLLVVRRDMPLNTYYPVVNATFKIPAGRSIPDWPLPCPKCGRRDSAVLLFSSFDCKHGCYK